MTENEALRAISTLIVFDRKTWSDVEIEAWTQALVRCTDAGAAMRASETLAQELDPRDWSLHRWRDAYRAAIAASAPVALPMPTEHAISLDEYKIRLTAREARGDQDAGIELERWRRLRSGQIIRRVS